MEDLLFNTLKKIEDQSNSIKDMADYKEVYNLLYSLQYEMVLVDKRIRYYSNKDLSDMEKMNNKRYIKLYTAMNKLMEVIDKKWLKSLYAKEDL